MNNTVKPSMDDFASRPKKPVRSSLSNNTNKYTILDLNNEKVSIQKHRIEINACDLENKTKASFNNTRLFIGKEFRSFGLYKELENSKFMSIPAEGYRLPNDDTIYLANGKTRRAVILDLFKTQGIEIKFVVDVIDITQENMWIADKIRDISDSNRKLSWLEDSLRMALFYNEIVHLETLSANAFNEQYALKIASKPLSKSNFKAKITVGVLWPIFEATLTPYLTSSSDFSFKQANSLLKTMELISGNSIELSKGSGPTSVIKTDLESHLEKSFEDAIDLLKDFSKEHLADKWPIDKFLKEFSNLIPNPLKTSAKQEPVVSISQNKIKGRLNFSFSRDKLNKEENERAEKLAKIIQSAHDELITIVSRS